jgi:hypothetical protein
MVFGQAQVPENTQILLLFGSSGFSVYVFIYGIALLIYRNLPVISETNKA